MLGRVLARLRDCCLLGLLGLRCCCCGIVAWPPAHAAWRVKWAAAVVLSGQATVAGCDSDTCAEAAATAAMVPVSKLAVCRLYAVHRLHGASSLSAPQRLPHQQGSSRAWPGQVLRPLPCIRLRAWARQQRLALRLLCQLRALLCDAPRRHPCTVQSW